MYGEAPLSVGRVERLLVDAWELDPMQVEYLRVGYGSYHWRASTGNGDTLFVTADSVDSSFPVRAAYELASELASSGLEFVRAPIANSDDAVVIETAGWIISLWPWLDGATSDFGRHQRDGLEATLSCIRRLHDHQGSVPAADLIEGWDLDGRDALRGLMTSDSPTGGPYAKEVRRRLGAHASRIDDLLSRYDDLVAATAARGAEFVITHGEPHAGNVIHTEAGTKLIDWDTVRWAPRERDLWSLVDQEGFRDGYGDFPRSADILSADILEIYRLQWDLTEIADFAVSLTGARRTDADMDVALSELQRLLPE